eukprot:Pgem_evm1s9044
MQSIVIQYSPDTNLRLLVYTTIVSVVQLVLALCPSLEKFEFISILGFGMSIVYTVIAIGLCFDLKVAGVLPEPNYSISAGKSTVDLVFDILGKWYHATGHICCAMIGTGVLGLAQAFSQLSWYIGPITLFIAFIAAYYCSKLLSYVHIDPNGNRLNTYTQIGKYLVGPGHIRWVVLP